MLCSDRKENADLLNFYEMERLGAALFAEPFHIQGFKLHIICHSNFSFKVIADHLSFSLTEKVKAFRFLAKEKDISRFSWLFKFGRSKIQGLLGSQK